MVLVASVVVIKLHRLGIRVCRLGRLVVGPPSKPLPDVEWFLLTLFCGPLVYAEGSNGSNCKSTVDLGATTERADVD